MDIASVARAAGWSADTDVLAALNPLSHPVCLSTPRYLSWVPSWHEHLPFAMLLVDLTRPGTFVELGTHYGDSYCSFLQAVAELGLGTRCFAVDTWTGDAHSLVYGPEVLETLRAHHDPLYGGFSRLVKSTFDEALQHFADGTIDLLHIDGYHTYEAVRHDFDTWLPKLSERAVVVLHDINLREGDAGVWRMWDEVRAQWPSFAFTHGHGLGVLGIGPALPAGVQPLFRATPEEAARVSSLFFALGRRVDLMRETTNLGRQVGTLEAHGRELEAALAAREQELAQSRAATDAHAAAAAALEQALAASRLEHAATQEQHTHALEAHARRLEALDAERIQAIGHARASAAETRVLRAERDRWRGELDLIQSGLIYRGAAAWWRVANRLLPPGTRRRSVAGRLARMLRGRTRRA